MKKTVFWLGCLLIIALTASCAHRKGAVAPAADAQATAQAVEVPAAQAKAAENDSEALSDEDEEWMDEEEDAPLLVADPLEPWNRMMFHTNDKLYFWVLKPLAQAYSDVFDEDVRGFVRNFFNNVATPVRLVNCLLQGKLSAGGTELSRLAINSTVGVLGFNDAAARYFDMPPPPAEDLGQTLASYQIGDGFYLYWPILGPSSLRDTLGMAGDYFLDPLQYVEPDRVATGLSVTKQVNAASFRIGDYETLKEAALSPYEAFRDAYIQYRRRQIAE